MAIRNIFTIGDEVLNKKCRKVDKFDERLHTLLDDMKETMKDANGVGLAAPQVGILKRAMVIDVGDGPIEFINPEIIYKEGEVNDLEGCLSVPGKYGYVVRPKKVTIKAQDRNGFEFTMEGEDLLARAMCHETEHLDGILYVTHVTEFVEPEEEN